MSIKINAPFELGTATPVDTRLTLSKAEMLTVNDNVWPSKYFTVCSDDGAIYLYDKTNEMDVETGKFRVLSLDDTSLKVFNVNDTTTDEEFNKFISEIECVVTVAKYNAFAEWSKIFNPGKLNPTTSTEFVKIVKLEKTCNIYYFTQKGTSAELTEIYSGVLDDTTWNFVLEYPQTILYKIIPEITDTTKNLTIIYNGEDFDSYIKGNLYKVGNKTIKCYSFNNELYIESDTPTIGEVCYYLNNNEHIQSTLTKNEDEKWYALGDPNKTSFSSNALNSYSEEISVVGWIPCYDLSSKQDILSETQLAAVNSTISISKVQEFSEASLNVAKKNSIFQFDVFPDISRTDLPAVFQYTGETIDDVKIKGHFYEKISTLYSSWERTDTQAQVLTLTDAIVGGDVLDFTGDNIIGTITEISESSMKYQSTDGDTIETTYHLSSVIPSFKEVYDFDTSSLATKEALSSVENMVISKQDKLSNTQLESVNSTITKDKVDSFEALKTSKQDSLTAIQLKAVNSGITSDKVSVYDNYATTKQDTLSQEQLNSIDSVKDKQDALTTDQLNAINSGITADNFNELNTEVETIKNDQETLDNDLGTLSNTVGLKDDLPDTSKSITQNISSISTKVSGLIKDDESSATTTYSSSKILDLIGDIHTFDVLVVGSLPDVGVEKTIYFVPATTTKEQNIYDEYLYINNAWELIGSTQVDLSDYLKIDGSNGTETGINTLLNLISAGEDDILDTDNILFGNTAFKKKTVLSFANYLKGKIIDDTTASPSTVYSSSKIEEINTPVWSGTQSEFEVLDKTTLKDGQVINITDDYDEPDSYPVITVYDNGFVFKYKNGVMQQYGKGTISEGYVAFFENFINTGYIIVYSSSNASAHSMGNRFVTGFGVAGSVDGDIIDYVATGKWK